MDKTFEGLRRERIISNKPLNKDLEWFCTGCGNRLGWLDREQKVLRLHRKDFYGFFEGGVVTVNCWVCAKVNSIGDQAKAS